MIDEYRLDGHKLMYHVERVNDWLKGDDVYPIYVEISPSGACNQRCVFCGLDFMKYQSRFLNTSILADRLQEMGVLGVKAINYSGEGEPLLHKEIDDIILDTKKAGIDVGVTTNGVFLERLFSVLENLTWVKISVNAATKETYTKIHRSNSFDRVMRNLHTIAGIKRNEDYKCTLGIQFLLLPENFDEVAELAQTVKDIGVDYFVVKPYSRHLQSNNTKYDAIKYDQYFSLLSQLEELSDNHFNVVVRWNSMKNWDNPSHYYDRCLALPFWAHIDSGGNVWGCGNHLDDERFYYGNINQQSFEDIWMGGRRKKSLRWVAKDLDTSSCRVNCRMNEINSYLWRLTHPSQHDNFI
jgi:wyosine [tRNA(Phe)-imidazoG37] synthetase (radical SAM superfamily)